MFLVGVFVKIPKFAVGLVVFLESKAFVTLGGVLFAWAAALQPATMQSPASAAQSL
jgi:hypothetical protein